jgi:hypothetical protein
MCIVCNVKEAGELPSNIFLEEYKQAQVSMRRAAEALHATLPHASTLKAKKQYARIHKQLVKLRRDWNRLEHLREVDLTDHAETRAP